MPTPPPDWTEVYRLAALAMAAVSPGCRRVRIVADAPDGQEVVIPVPAGVWVPFAEQPAPPAAPQDEDDDEPAAAEDPIVDVLRDAGNVLTADEIAAELGVKNGPRFRERLSALVKAERLKNHRPGYSLADAVKPGS